MQWVGSSGEELWLEFWWVPLAFFFLFSFRFPVPEFIDVGVLFRSGTVPS